MNICFIGNFSVDYSSESHYLWTFTQKLGCTVYPIQENETNKEKVSNTAKDCDMLFHVHTHGWDIEGIGEVYRELKVLGIPTVGYHLDLWMGIEREKDLDTDPYWQIEYFFCTDKLMVDHLNSLDEKPKAYYLPAGVVERECYMAESDRDEFPHEIVFTGSRGYHSEWPYRAELIDWLKETYGDRFGHYGNDGIRVVRGDELNTLYASAKIVVGDTLCKNFQYPYYFSDRLFETTGRGAFVIFPFIESIGDQFNLLRPVELVTYSFGDFDDLKHKIDLYLKYDKEREKIRIAGHERAKKEHTYTKRLQYILDTIK